MPTDRIDAFIREYERDFGGIKDLFKDALINLMIGNEFHTANDKLFYEQFLPAELETQFWVKMKLAAYEPSQEGDTGYLEYPMPAGYKAYHLENLHKLISEEYGWRHFMVAEEGTVLGEARNALNYFRVLMLIGKFEEVRTLCLMITHLRHLKSFLQLMTTE